MDVVFLISQTATAFPGARILLIVPDDARTWRRERRRLLPDVGISTAKGLYAGDHRLVVATPGSLGLLDIERMDLVFVAGPLTLTWNDQLLESIPADPPSRESRYRVNLMAKLADVRGRLFGIVPRHFWPSRYEAGRLAQMFSVNEYVVAGPVLPNDRLE